MPCSDDEGLLDADGEIFFCRGWKDWCASLTTCHRGALWLWRAGVVVTPMRMQGSDPASLTLFPCRACARASARQFWADCAELRSSRRRDLSVVGFYDGWWSRQPPCTAESGWLAFVDAASLQKAAS